MPKAVTSQNPAPLLLEAKNVSEAYSKVLLHILEHPGKEIAPLVLTIEGFEVGYDNRIIDLGTAESDDFLPRVDSDVGNSFRQDRMPFQQEIERDRVAFLASRMVRDRLFRRRIVTAYDARCAVTGLKLINGGGRAEVEAAHIRPVEHGGPDIVSNGIALSGTVHWMFDRGLISLKDDLEIMVSRQANDPAGIRSLVNRTGFAVAPPRTMEHPHPSFLAWHRDNCFKH